MNSLFDIEEVQQNNEKLLRVKELEKLIKKYQDSYYNGEGEISDAEFDSLWDELKLLDPENSILHKVGADSGNFNKVNHIMPMGSQLQQEYLLTGRQWVQVPSPCFYVFYRASG